MGLPLQRSQVTRSFCFGLAPKCRVSDLTISLLPQPFPAGEGESGSSLDSRSCGNDAILRTCGPAPGGSLSHMGLSYSRIWIAGQARSEPDTDASGDFRHVLVLFAAGDGSTQRPQGAPPLSFLRKQESRAGVRLARRTGRSRMGYIVRSAESSKSASRLSAFLSVDSAFHAVMNLIPDEAVHTILLGKAIRLAVLVLQARRLAMM